MEMTKRVIEASEEERRHIARELHDDFCQRLSLICAQLASREVVSNNSGTSNQRDPSKPLEELDSIVADIHNLSHRLHSSKLEHLGLKYALAELCDRSLKSMRCRSSCGQGNFLRHSQRTFLCACTELRKRPSIKSLNIAGQLQLRLCSTKVEAAYIWRLRTRVGALIRRLLPTVLDWLPWVNDSVSYTVFSKLNRSQEWGRPSQQASYSRELRDPFAD